MPRNPRPDRRTFLKRAALMGLTLPTIPTLGCRAEDGGAPAADSLSPSGSRITRPVLLPWSSDAVWMTAPASELPVAYVSMAQRRVFVDHAFRDRASWLLDAHISVSTAHWRIPLAGDVPGEPIMPGDALREFEELGIRDLDPSVRPAEGDIRIGRGGRVSSLVDFSCVPVAGTDQWCSAGPWTLVRCGDNLDEVRREDFGVVGPGQRYGDRACSEPAEAVVLFSWAVRG